MPDPASGHVLTSSVAASVAERCRPVSTMSLASD